jgi:hypothetical protein
MTEEKLPSKVIICTPTVTKPYQCYLDSLAASVPSLEAAGWLHGSVFEVGCPYISHARSKLLRKALDAGATAVIFIDHDLAWQPDALLRLLEAEGEVVSGTYRFKRDPEEYMGSVITDDDGLPAVREDGCIEAHSIPAGMLRITREGVNHFMRQWPELCFGEACSPSVDLFNHGAHEGVWWGEDYAFARRWRERCGKVWLMPDLQIDHHTSDMAYPGNFHEFLLRQPGGSEAA